MPDYCSVADCTQRNREDREQERVGLHRCPLKDPKISTAWIKACRRRDQLLPKSTRICSLHFTPEDYERDLRNELLGLPTRRMLKKGAIPSVFPGRDKEPSEKVLARRERAQKRKWEEERKKIVEELLKNAEAEESCSNDDHVSLSGGGGGADEYDFFHCPATPPPPSPPPEPDYFELTKDHLLRKIDALWQVVSFKNKKISSVEQRIVGLENQLRQAKLQGFLQEDQLQHQQILDNEDITGLEQSVADFCNYNKIHLRTLDLISKEEEKLRLVEECRTNTPTLRLTRTEYDPNKRSRLSSIDSDYNCATPVECDDFVEQEIGNEQSKSVKTPEQQEGEVENGPKIWVYECTKCSTTFRSFAVLLVHLKEKHRHEYQKTPRPGKSCPHCKSCGTGKYNNHLRYRNEACSESQEQEPPPFRRVLMPIKSREAGPGSKHNDEIISMRTWKCDDCKHRFATYGDYTRHKREVHPECLVKCDHCEFTFVSLHYKTVHTRIMHAVRTDIKKWKCHKCDEAFYTLRQKLNHHREVHKRVAEIKTCPYCKKKFRGENQYTDHVRQHTGERPFLCSVCGYAARNESLLKRHSESVHEKLGKPHICMYCGQSFKKETGLKLHERMYHEDTPGHTCPHCNKVVACVNRHVKEVHQSGAQVCRVCKGKFATLSDLADHLKAAHNKDARDYPDPSPSTKERTGTIEEGNNLNLNSNPTDTYRDVEIFEEVSDMEIEVHMIPPPRIIVKHPTEVSAQSKEKSAPKVKKRKKTKTLQKGDDARTLEMEVTEAQTMEKSASEIKTPEAVQKQDGETTVVIQLPNVPNPAEVTQ